MRGRYAATAALLLVLAGCGSGADDGAPAGTALPSGPDTIKPSDGASGSADGPTDEGSDPSGDPTRDGAGTAADPVTVTATEDLLAWRDAGDPTATVTAGEDHVVTVGQSRTSARIEGPGGPWTIAPGGRFRVGDVLLDDDRAVVVAQDRLEERPARAIVVDLETGDQRVLDGGSTPPTVNGGTWAMGDDRIVHATVRGRDYCLAVVDAETLAGEVAWCAEPRHGFTNARVTDAGASLMTFDDARPSCRTLADLDGADLVPLPDVAECAGWEAVRTDGGHVWTEVPKPQQVEVARVRATVDGIVHDLGPAISGSLVECDGAAYFSRDPKRDRGPAQVLRWDGSTLAVVYESPAARGAIVSAPRCGDSALTVTALTEAGDEQVTAVLD